MLFRSEIGGSRQSWWRRASRMCIRIGVSVCIGEGSRGVDSYRFNAPDPVLLKETPYEGTMHTSDLYFLMDGT